MSLILNELKIANSLSVLGTMTTLGTAEGIRMANDAGFISFYNTANTARTGYVQGLYGTALRIGTDGSTEMQFYIGGSQQMVINTSGNVGIGATSPSEKLHVNGGNAYIAYSTDTATYSSTAFNSSPRLALLCKSATSAYNFIRFTAGGSHEWAVGTVHKSTGVADYVFQSYDGSAYGERLRILANGNVGIGTTAPAYKLHVTDGNNSIAYFGPNTSWSSYLAVGAGDNKIANGTAQVISTNGNLHLDSGTAQNTYINYYSQTGTFINVNAGNVGIGTESPGAKLDVNGDVKISRAITMHSEAQDIDSRFYGGTFIRGWQSFTAGSESSITYTTDSTSPVGTEVISVSTYVWARGPKIRLDKTQNYEVEMWVKRQTANTAGTFYFVVSNYDSSGNIISGDGNDWHYPTSINPLSATWTKYRFVVGPYGGSKDHSSSARYISVGFIANYTTGTDVIYFTGFKCRPIPRYNNDPLTIYNNGNVGIGTTSPTAKLDVNGDTKITGSLLVTGSMTIAGDLIPAADRMYSLGSSTRRWNDLYVISSSISQITESLMTISNEYTLAVVNGNRVAGFKIAINNQTSSFVIQADKFAVVNTSGVNPISPFIIENNIVYINSASIKNLTADSIAANTITADRIKANTITANEISASSITADRIRANTITANEISASAITTDKLAANSITTDKLQANSITATQISASAITTDKLAANSITTDKLTANVITSNEISSSAITTDKLAANSITATKISASAIITTHLSASIIDADKIQSNAVITTHLSASAITTAKIAADAITATQISASAITTSKIASDAIVSSHISASAITTAKIAADAVTATQISASAITSAKIAADAITSTQISASAIIASKIATDAITSTHISASAITSAKIAADAVTATQISASAITTAKIAADAIVSSHISASAITSTKIAADAVTATQISASAITSDKIATDAITATHISASVITTSKIAADAITSTQISASAIIASKIATDAITSTHISASAITTNKLDANAVTAAKIAAGTITATEISASAITGDRIAANTITATQISASAITTEKIAAGAITANMITAGTMDAARITAGTITATQISASAITTNLIAAGAITAAKIAAGTITANEISASAITSAKIAAGAITADMITAGTMNAARISGGTISGVSLDIGSGTFQVASNGNITSTGGTIAGWTIAPTTLSSGGMTINSTGKITGNNGLEIDATTNQSYIKINGAGAYQLTLTGGVANAALTLGTGAAAVTLTQSDGLSLYGKQFTFSSSKFRFGASGTETIVCGTIEIGTGGLSCTGGGAFSGTVGINSGAITLNSDGTVTASSFNSSSSRRYKKNIVEFKSGLSIVEKLRPVTFDWKNKSVKNEIGLIAEEVNKVLPNIVYKNEEGKVESLDYSKLTPVLLAAIKELTGEIKELKSRINKLETK